MAVISDSTSSRDQVVATDPGGPIRLISSTTGAQVVKGGQHYNDSLLDSIKAAYFNTVYNPLIIGFYVLALAILCVDKPGTDGPLEILVQKFNTTATTSHVATNVAVASIMTNILSVLVSLKSMFVMAVLWFTPTILKPSSYNVLFSLVSSLFILAWGAIPTFALIWLSQMFFLYTQLRAPVYRFLILALGALSLFSFFSVSPESYRASFTTKLVSKFIDLSADASHVDFTVTNIRHLPHKGEDHIFFELHHKIKSTGADATEAPITTWRAGIEPSIAGPYLVPTEVIRTWFDTPGLIEYKKHLRPYRVSLESPTTYVPVNSDTPRVRKVRSVEDDEGVPELQSPPQPLAPEEPPASTTPSPAVGKGRTFLSAPKTPTETVAPATPVTPSRPKPTEQPVVPSKDSAAATDAQARQPTPFTVSKGDSSPKPETKP